MIIDIGNKNDEPEQIADKEAMNSLEEIAMSLFKKILTGEWDEKSQSYKRNWPEYMPREDDPPEFKDALTCTLIERERERIPRRYYTERGDEFVSGKWIEARESVIQDPRKGEDGKWLPLSEQLNPLCSRDCQQYKAIDFMRDENDQIIELKDENGNVGPMIIEGEPTMVISMREGYSRKNKDGKFKNSEDTIVISMKKDHTRSEIGKFTDKRKENKKPEYTTRQVRRTAEWTETKEAYKTAFYNISEPEYEEIIIEDNDIIKKIITQLKEEYGLSDECN